MGMYLSTIVYCHVGHMYSNINIVNWLSVRYGIVKLSRLIEVYFSKDYIFLQLMWERIVQYLTACMSSVNFQLEDPSVILLICCTMYFAIYIQLL